MTDGGGDPEADAPCRSLRRSLPAPTRTHQAAPICGLGTCNIRVGVSACVSLVGLPHAPHARLCAPALALGAKGILPHTLLELTVRANRKRLTGDECPQQLSLLLQAPRPKPRPRRAVTGKSDRPRILALDQRMSTAEVLRVVGVNRSTLFRWIQKGRFPRKHASGGWLRSDIEHWLSRRAAGPEPETAHLQH
jgi:predicted DNA-binding transcriptional regulator AlpA